MKQCNNRVLDSQIRRLVTGDVTKDVGHYELDSDRRLQSKGRLIIPDCDNLRKGAMD